MSPDRPRLDGSLDAARWGAALREGRLVGQECETCGHVTATPKAGCLRCGSTDLAAVELEPSGEIHVTSHVDVAPKGLDPGYQVGIVELAGAAGARLLARVEGEVDIGDSVELVDVFEAEEPPSPVFAPSE